MKTAAEDKASQIQDMASQLDLSTPQGLKLFARMLNNQGMTEEAMKVFDLASAKEAQALDTRVKERSLANRDIKVIGSKRDIYGNVTNKYGYWDPELGQVVEVSPQEVENLTNPNNTSDIKTTAEDLKKSWGG
jgi:hypothetical protein